MGSGTGTDRPRIWIDAGHPIFRRGLAACLQADGFDVVGASADFSPPPRRRGLDVLLFEADGMGLPMAVQSVDRDTTHLVALLRTPTETLVGDAVEAGVGAILLHTEIEPAALARCLRSVVNGNATLPSTLLTRLLDQASNGARHASGGLTTREIDVLRLLADGSDTKEIASKLCYSERTVKNVVHDVLVKMNCRNRAHAVAMATRQGAI